MFFRRLSIKKFNKNKVYRNAKKYDTIYQQYLKCYPNIEGVCSSDSDVLDLNVRRSAALLFEFVS